MIEALLIGLMVFHVGLFIWQDRMMQHGKRQAEARHIKWNAR